MLISIVQPYYRNPTMLRLQIENWACQTALTATNIEWIVIDDCSPEPAEPIFREFSPDHLTGIRLLRVIDDIPWNQHGCRNLGAREAKGEWLQMQDMDRMVLPQDQEFMVRKIMANKIAGSFHYKARGINVKKDRPLSDFKPIVNQFWVTKKAYWQVGGYDEDYCGCYGGDGPLLRALEDKFPLKVLNDIIMLRYDRHIISDATTQDLDRSGAEYQRRSRAKRVQGNVKPVNPVRFKWKEISLS